MAIDCLRALLAHVDAVRLDCFAAAWHVPGCYTDGASRAVGVRPLSGLRSTAPVFWDRLLMWHGKSFISEAGANEIGRRNWQFADILYEAKEETR
jgi:hypothetical protein